MTGATDMRVQQGAALHGTSILCFFCCTADCPGSFLERCRNLRGNAGCARGVLDLGGLHSLCQEAEKRGEEKSQKENTSKGIVTGV